MEKDYVECMWQSHNPPQESHKVRRGFALLLAATVVAAGVGLSLTYWGSYLAF